MSRVAVVGGGLAGLTAALRCADAGHDVVLLEAAPRLGGLTSSFLRGDLVVDNGQHVFLRCCTRYLALLERLGVRDLVELQARLDVTVLEPGGRTHRLARGRLPAPLHLVGALLRYRALDVRERLSVVRAVLALGRVRADDPAADAVSFGDFLRAHGQDRRTVAALWDLVGVATLNARVDEASLALAATVFQTGLLRGRAAGDLGWSRVPLAELHAGPAAAALRSAGAQVRCRARVQALARAGDGPSDGWCVVLRDGAIGGGAGGAGGGAAAAGGAAGGGGAGGGAAGGGAAGGGPGERVHVDAVVLAVPPAAAERLLPPGTPPGLQPGWALRLGSAPVVDVHLVYDRVVLDRPFAAGLGSPVQWVFDRTRQSGLADGQCLAVSLSAAQDLVDLPVAALRELVAPAVADLLPAARDAELRDVFVTREREATFRPAPGSAALRPGPDPGVPGLALAGAWTATGWPATMEGAVRSGEAAAARCGAAAPGARWTAAPPRRTAAPPRAGVAA